MNKFTNCSWSNIIEFNSYSYAEVFVTAISFSVHPFQSCCQASSLVMLFFLYSDEHLDYAKTAVIKCRMNFKGTSPKQPSIISDLTEVIIKVSCITSRFQFG